MKPVFACAWIALFWGLALTPSAPAESSPGKTNSQAYLRYLCAHEGNVRAKNFGEWPKFQPTLRLIWETGPSGTQMLTTNLLPLSSAAYQPIALAAGKVVVQETPAEAAGKTVPKELAALNLQPKTGYFYTLLICGEGTAMKLTLLEDEPAVLPPPKEGELPPPPRRSLRCLVLESGFRVKVSCPEAGVKIEASPEKSATAENLKKGIWSLKLEGEQKGAPFQTTLEVDFESPSNFTLVFMKDIYGRIAPCLLRDASLD